MWSGKNKFWTCILLLFLGTQTFAQLQPASPAASPPLKTLELEWESVENAGSYEIKLVPIAGGEPILFEVPENHFSKDVPVGKYLLQMRTKSKDGRDTSPWTSEMSVAVVARELAPIQPAHESVIDGAGKTKATVEFEWSEVENAKEYVLSVWSEDRKDKPWVFTTKARRKKLEVPTAEVYYWEVKFESADSVAYQQQPKTFSFTLLGNRLTKPEIQIPSLTCTDKLMQWKGPKEATRFEASLFFRFIDETEWRLVKQYKGEDPKMPCSKLKAGVYKLEVIAKADRRSPSEPATEEFSVKPKWKELQRALRQAKLSIEE